MNLQLEHTTPEDMVATIDAPLFPQTDSLVGDTRKHVDDLPRILAELVIEEVSIDGMCGVY